MPVSPELYTHDFKYETGSGRFIRGEIEFNKDKKSSFRIKAWSEPLHQETLRNFNKLIDLLMDIYVENGGIDKIQFKKKDI